MAKGLKTGGRIKGTPNKESQDLFALCISKGLDVFGRMVEITAKEKDESRQFAQLLEIAPYLYAKRKALEVDLDVDPAILEAFKAMQGLSEDELRKIVADELRKAK